MVAQPRPHISPHPQSRASEIVSWAIGLHVSADLGGCFIATAALPEHFDLAIALIALLVFQAPALLILMRLRQRASRRHSRPG